MWRTRIQNICQKIYKQRKHDMEYVTSSSGKPSLTHRGVITTGFTIGAFYGAHICTNNPSYGKRICCSTLFATMGGIVGLIYPFIISPPLLIILAASTTYHYKNKK